jgi:hypothetical protein
VSNIPVVRDEPADPGANKYPTGSRGPIVLLTYEHSGAEEFQRVLSASPSLACTSGTGILPLCYAAMTTWQKAEGRDSPSSLAVKSVRGLVSAITTVIQARAGAPRWCETAVATPIAAAAFARIFPDTTFLCLHRSFPGVLGASLRGYPSGLGNSPFWPYSGPFAGNNAATIAAYWAARTEALLDFETEHAASSCRFRYEDLTSNPIEQAVSIYTRLQLERWDPAALRQPGDQREHDAPTDDSAVIVASGYQMPPELRATVNRLCERLGYQALPDPRSS